MLDTMHIDAMAGLARRIRITSLKMVHSSQTAHIGSCLSCADILAVLYGGILLGVTTTDADMRSGMASRDRFVFSKGHAAAALYAVLGEVGLMPQSKISSFCTDGCNLEGHPSMSITDGIDATAGSLGHGLGFACGLALANQLQSTRNSVYCLMGDGELDEGSVWEAAAFAGHHRLVRLTAVIDDNGMQALGATNGILNMEPLDKRFTVWGWDVLVVDGHDVGAMWQAFSAPPGDKPRAIICKTIKGKGVSFMEGELLWHYRAPNDEEYVAALRELGE